MPYRAKGDKVYEKKGGLWVVIKTYTKEKDGKTPEQQAAAYAIALNMGHARGKGYIITPAPKAAALPGGVFMLGELQIPVARLGKWLHPTYGEVTFTQKDFDQIIANFEADRVGYTPFVRIGHTRKDADVFAGEPALAWVTAFMQKGDVLYAAADPTDAGTEKLVKEKKYRYASLEYEDPYMDKATGKTYGAAVKAIALTNQPFLPGLPDVAVLSDDGYILHLADPSLRADILSLPKEVPMDEFQTDVMEQLKEQKTAIETQGGVLKKLGDIVQAAFAKLIGKPANEPPEQADAGLVAVKEDIEKRLSEARQQQQVLEKRLFLSEVRDKVSRLREEGRFPAILNAAERLLAALDAPRERIQLSDAKGSPKETTVAEGILAICEAAPKVDLRVLGQPHAPDEKSLADAKKKARELVEELGYKAKGGD